jgi:Cu2+-exporting ATPase
MSDFNITGMTCAACQLHVEKAVKELKNVDSVSVSLLTNSMTVQGDASSEEIIKAVEKAGYGASVSGEEKTESNSNYIEKEEELLKDRETPKLLKRLRSSLIFLLVLMYFTMGHNMLGFPVPVFLHENYLGLTLLQMILAMIIMYINKAFFISGIRSLKNLAPNMDSLVALGSGVSFLWSLYIFLKMTILVKEGNLQSLMHIYHNELYFESAAMIPALITVGKTLEAISKGHTTDALKSLIKIAPKKATIEINGTTKEIDADDVKAGDVVIIKSGDKIPVDGIIIDGDGAVDESSLTGESVPVDKTAGDHVFAATILSSGYFKVRCEKTGKDTSFYKIIKMVEESSRTKAPIARIADKVSYVFVPSIIALSIMVFLIHILNGALVVTAVERAISVLVVSCPCALGLATPVAIMVGNGVGAKNGILFKTSEAMEMLGKADIIALDKTGTITEGTPVVTKVKTFKGFADSELLQIANSLEERSEHPISKAITDYCHEKDVSSLEIDDFKVLPGKGISGNIDGNSIYAGSLNYIKDLSEIDDEIMTSYEEIAEAGGTPVLFAREKEIIGIIGVADTIKDDSVQAIKAMKKLGLKVIMLTGDNEKTARAIANLAGVDSVVANVLPEEKERVIRELKKLGKTVMVGDGINDAPSLTTADIGIAIGHGTDVAIESADMVLMNSRLSDVAAAIRLSRHTLMNIYENLFWAFIYNVLLIPAAAGLYGFITMKPMYGAAAMAISSVTVCLNALRINLFNPYKDTGDKRSFGAKNIDLNQIKNIENNNEKGENKMKETVKIEGMMCAHCEMNVKKALEAIDGIEEAVVSHESGTAEISLSKEVSDEAIKSAIEAKDYKFVSISK